MATKKAGSTAKKTTKKSAPSKPSTTTTKVTTVKAVVADADSPVKTSRFNKNRIFIASALVGEFIGTFLLAIAFMGTKGDPLYVGFSLVGIVLIVSALSGAHVNPAVTVGVWVTRKMTSLRALGYILAQVLGATLAFTTLQLFIGSAPAVDPQTSAMMGQSGPELFRIAAVEKNQWHVFFVELVAATIFTFAVASARRQQFENTAAKALTVGLGLMIAGVFGTIVAGYVQANTVFNPAIALAVQAVDWTKIDWVVLSAYLIAPLLGGVIGFGLREVLDTVSNKKA